MTSQSRSPLGSERLVERIRAEFCEMPGMRLTSRQAQRLWSLDQETCRTVLDNLVNSGFLVRSGQDTYTRLMSGAETSRLRMAKSSAGTARARLGRASGA